MTSANHAVDPAKICPLAAMNPHIVPTRCCVLV